MSEMETRTHDFRTSNQNKCRSILARKSVSAEFDQIDTYVEALSCNKNK